MTISTVDLPAPGKQIGDTGHVTDSNQVYNALQVLAQQGAFGTQAATYMPYNVRSYGAAGDGVTDDTAAIMGAFDAAEGNGGGKVIYFPTGKYLISGGLNLSGYSSVIRGDGGVSASTSGGTELIGTAQTGPLINLDGWKNPATGRGRAVFEGFTITGDGVGDALKTHAGIYLNAVANVTVRDVAIWNTGGPGLRVGAASFCDFERIEISTPIQAKVNDVAFLRISAAVECRFERIGLYSTALAGPSGALVMDDTGSIPSHHNLFTGCWAEAFSVETGNTIVSVKGNQNILDDWMFTNVVKSATSATGTSCIRVLPPSVTDTGANAVRGILPGSSGGTTDIDTGVEVAQSRCLIEGVRAASGTAVSLRAGVGHTTVILKGTLGAPSAQGVADSSGQTTNTIIDGTVGVAQLLTGSLSPKAVIDGGAGLQVADASTPANGALWLGNSGARIQTDPGTPKSLIHTGDLHTFRDSTATRIPFVINGGTSAPGVLMTGQSGQPAARLSGGLDFAVDAVNDIGTDGARRPRNLYLSGLAQTPKVLVRPLVTPTADLLTVTDTSGAAQAGVNSGYGLYAPGFDSVLNPGIFLAGNNDAGNTNSAQSASFKEQNCNTVVVTITRQCDLRLSYSYIGHADSGASNRPTTMQACLHKQTGNVSPSTSSGDGTTIDVGISGLVDGAQDLWVGNDFIDFNVTPGTYTYNMTFMPRSGAGYKNGQYAPSRLYVFIVRLH